MNTKPSGIITRGKRQLNNAPLQQHAQVMREAKRLREQIRVRAVNSEYTHLNHTLGLKKQSKSLPKISKQQTLKTCIEHIKLLTTEMGEIMNSSPFGKDPFSDLKDTQAIPILQRQLYLPNYFPLPNFSCENELIDDMPQYGHHPYMLPYIDNELDTFLIPRLEDTSSTSDLYNTSETFDSDLSPDFPNYTDSFCSTPDSCSSNYSWMMSPEWGNLGDN